MDNIFRQPRESQSGQSREREFSVRASNMRNTLHEMCTYQEKEILIYGMPTGPMILLDEDINNLMRQNPDKKETKEYKQLEICKAMINRRHRNFETYDTQQRFVQEPFTIEETRIIMTIRAKDTAVIDNLVLTETDKDVLRDSIARQSDIDNLFPADLPYDHIVNHVKGDGSCRICLHDIDPLTHNYFVCTSCWNAVHRDCQNKWLWYSDFCNTCHAQILPRPAP